jgi:AbrB family looped-hinge helix DNA binding protein
MSASERLTTVVSTKGQVILPKIVRQNRNWPAGTKLVVEETSDGVLLRRAPLFEATQMSDVFARLKTDGGPRTVEDMDASVVAEARRRHVGD